MKKITAILIAVALAVCLMATIAFADASLTVSASETTATMGDEFVVSVDVSGNTGFSYCMGTVTYDSSVLKLTALNDGLMAGSTKNVNTGKISFSSSTNVEGDGTLFTATFKVLDQATVGSSDVSVSVKMRASDGSWLMNGTSDSTSVTVECNHNWDDWKEVTAATCTATGTEIRSCTICDEVETRTTPMISHTPGEATKENEVAATCDKEGSYDEVITCTVCGEEISHETKTVAALGHTLTATEAKAATCQATGNIAYWYCSVCEKYFSDAEGKTEITAEDTITPVDSTAHVWGEWQVTKEATPEEAGEKTHTCSVCNETETQEIPKVHVHILVGTEAKEATCTEAGNIAYWTCSECGLFFSDEDGTTEIKAKDTVIAALGHDYKGAVTAPTCTEEGYTTFTCSRCGKSYTANPTAATGHTFVEGVCTVCGEKKSDDDASDDSSQVTPSADASEVIIDEEATVLTKESKSLNKIVLKNAEGLTLYARVTTSYKLQDGSTVAFVNIYKVVDGVAQFANPTTPAGATMSSVQVAIVADANAHLTPTYKLINSNAFIKV